MKVLIVGRGGREHALAWKTQQSPLVERVFVAPGNVGTALEPKTENIAIDATDIDRLIAFAKEKHIDLTIVGPETPLALGIVDRFNAEQLTCFGPTQLAAQLESSKTFSKDFMRRHNIPTASYENFTNIDEAKKYLASQIFPIVIKADGLAAGKGVVIAQTLEEAEKTVTDMLSGNAFGNAGARVVIEAFLQGEEASFLAIVSNNVIIPLASSQDHKARDDGDKGPNTGGMGAYSPAPVVTHDIHDCIMQHVIQPTVASMTQEGHPFTGVLYAGVMIDNDGNVKTLEFNCRFGDPETQPLMFRLKSDIVPIFYEAAKGTLTEQTLEWDSRVALGVVLAAGGYPLAYKKGDIITLPKQEPQDTKIFHAGTAQKDGNVITDGGRVLCATALGNNVRSAQQHAYSLIQSISWHNMLYRKDIGYRAL